jgi:hypothetical protein
MAKQPTPQQQEQGAMEKLQATFKRMREMEPTKLERGIVAALHDIHRRVIEEPWFGKPVFDILHNSNQRALTGQRDKPVDEDKQRVSEGPWYQHDYNPDALYGRNQDKETEQQNACERDDDHGMER